MSEIARQVVFVMTAQEWQTATQRLKELEEKKLLPAETIADLKRWWREKLVTERDGKVIKFEGFRT